LALSLNATCAFAGAAEDCGNGDEAAIAACTALIQSNPDDGAAYVNRGKAYLGKADYTSAIADFTEAIAIDPTDAKAYCGRGKVYLQTGDKEKAVADLKQALALDPELTEAKEALEKTVAAAESPALSSGASSATPTPEPGTETGADDQNSALSALREPSEPGGLSALSSPSQPEGGLPSEPSASPSQPESGLPSEPSASPSQPEGGSPKSSDMAVFVPDLPEEPSSDSATTDGWPTTPVAAKNYADETTDWGVQQQTVLKKDVGKKTPMFLPGARRITTQELQEIGPESLLLDVLDDTDHHITLPGAVHMPGAGDYGGGRFTDKLQKKFAKVLSDLTEEDLDRQLVFFCYGAECWESYNAALRAINLGYHNVLWYRGGLQSWKDAELPLVPPASTYPMR
jgi:PQQ-dependent catabolism-associated CXXCW motif protein